MYLATDGNTLLHNMTAPQNNTHQQESIEIVKILLEYGPGTDIANNRGHTALDFAISYRKDNMAELLPCRRRSMYAGPQTVRGEMKKTTN